MARADDFIESFLAHYASEFYDPVKAHEYYLKTRELKGRKTGQGLRTQGQKEAFNYSSAQIDAAQKADEQKAQASVQEQVQKLQEAAQAKAQELQTKLQAVMERLKQGRADNLAKVDADEKKEVSDIRTKMQADIQKASDDKNTEVTKIAEQRKLELARLADATQRQVDALPSIPKGLPESELQRLTLERSSKLAQIYGDASVARDDILTNASQKRDAATESYLNKKDSIREAANQQTEEAKSRASEKRAAINNDVANQANSQKESVNSERSTIAADLKAGVEQARQNYEQMKADLVTKYEGVRDQNFLDIKGMAPPASKKPVKKGAHSTASKTNRGHRK